MGASRLGSKAADRFSLRRQANERLGSHAVGALSVFLLLQEAERLEPIESHVEPANVDLPPDPPTNCASDTSRVRFRAKRENDLDELDIPDHGARSV